MKGLSGAQRELKQFGSELTHGSMAQMFALVCGLALIIAGVAAFVVNFDFSTGSSIVSERLLFMDVNGYSGVLMLVTGLVLLVGSRLAGTARRACVAVGVVYLAITVWSLFTASVAGILPVNDLTAIVYAAIGVLGLTAGLGPDPRSKDA
jgi:hypothetical protein